MSESWGARIKAHRKGQKRTQADLAAALGMGVRTIVSAEHDGPIRGDVAAAIISEVAPEEEMIIKSGLHAATSSGAIVFEQGITHTLAATPLGAYDGDVDEMDLEPPTVRQVSAPDAPRAFQRPPAPPVPQTEETADPVSGEQG